MYCSKQHKWPFYHILDTYAKAKRHAKRAEDTSNVESEEEDGPRSAKRPLRYQYQCASDSENGDGMYAEHQLINANIDWRHLSELSVQRFPFGIP